MPSIIFFRKSSAEDLSNDKYEVESAYSPRLSSKQIMGGSGEEIITSAHDGNSPEDRIIRSNNNTTINKNLKPSDSEEKDGGTSVASEKSMNFSFLYSDMGSRSAPPSLPADYEDDEDEEFSHSTKTVAFIAFAVFLLNLIGVSITLIIRDNHDSSSNASAEMAMDANLLRIVTPPAVKNDISNVCSSPSINTEIGFEDCKRKCHVAKCCYFPSDHAESCRGSLDANDMCKELETICKPVLHTLFAREFNHITFNHEAKSIESLCSKENLEKGDAVVIEKCYEACSPAECCFLSGEHSCLNSETENWCRMFSSCGLVYYAN